MTVEDAAAETDEFLERSGPPSLDFPFRRDNYYMLEAYLPNRGWKSEESRWLYASSLHDRDVEFAREWVTRRKASRKANDTQREVRENPAEPPDHSETEQVITAVIP